MNLTNAPSTDRASNASLIDRPSLTAALRRLPLCQLNLPATKLPPDELPGIPPSKYPPDSYEAYTLPPATKIALESRGFYGWWQSASPSPAPGPVCFGIPQRNLTIRDDRLKEVDEDVAKVYSIHDAGLTLSQHEEYVKILRREERLKGHRCFCQYPYEIESGRGLGGHLRNIENVLYLVYGIFQLAAEKVATVPLGSGSALMTDLKRVCARSYLAWHAFGFFPVKDSLGQPATSAGGVFHLSEDNPYVPALPNVDPSPPCQELVQTAEETCRLLADVAKLLWQQIRDPGPGDSGKPADVKGQTSCTPRSNAATQGTPRQQRPADLRTPVNPPGPIITFFRRLKEDALYCRDIAKRLYKDVILGEEDAAIWVPEDIKLSETSQQHLTSLINALNRIEARKLKKSPGGRDQVLVTFGEVARTLISHLRPEVLPPETLKALTADTDAAATGSTLFMKLRPKPAQHLVQDGLLGFRTHHGKEEAEDELPQPLPLTMEAPFCSVTDLVDPIRRQVQQRLEQMRARANCIKNIPHGESSDSNSLSEHDEYRPWWLRDDPEEMRNLRQHLREVRAEESMLCRQLEGGQFEKLEGPKARRGADEFFFDDRLISEEPQYAGPLENKPTALKQNLYGAEPGLMEEILHTDEDLALRPFRRMGQSKRELIPERMESALIRKETADEFAQMRPPGASWSFGQLMKGANAGTGGDSETSSGSDFRSTLFGVSSRT